MHVDDEDVARLSIEVKGNGFFLVRVSWYNFEKLLCIASDAVGEDSGVGGTTEAGCSCARLHAAVIA